jgi:hypothetical protein
MSKKKQQTTNCKSTKSDEILSIRNTATMQHVHVSASLTNESNNTKNDTLFLSFASIASNRRNRQIDTNRKIEQDNTNRSITIVSVGLTLQGSWSGPTSAMARFATSARSAVT